MLLRICALLLVIFVLELLECSIAEFLEYWGLKTSFGLNPSLSHVLSTARLLTSKRFGENHVLQVLGTRFKLSNLSDMLSLRAHLENVINWAIGKPLMLNRAVIDIATAKAGEK